ncbi:Tetratricopeptide repeat-containing protein [Nonlabens sp. Hel1_33_55]|uniref:tetratricopeptide repeat protein n=1 Tax=Nonlabens sp. Hel1_33_55 TaxID=1336802 RepID=UPI000875D476|nr:tetratricopeptide repeat protein [Nonlabens sp. Hel1_33_55]SCY08428.1 Tetratricopeptide repeat-containing protein [Nonlabens sp. Hel1_33_55]
MRNTLIILISILFFGCGAKKQTATKSNDIFAEAQEMIKNEQWKQAEERLNTLITLYPNNADLYFKRGYVREMDLRYEECIPDFTKAISLKPSMHTARTNRGFAYRNLEQYEKAIADFTAELAVNPNAYSYEHRSQVYYLTKEYGKALTDVNKSIQKDPNNSISFKTRALIYKATDLKKEACADKQTALELNILEKYPKYETDISELVEYCRE